MKNAICSCLILFITISCTKKNYTEAETKYTITGLWTGTIKSAGSPYQPYSLSIKSDNTIIFEGVMEGGMRHYGHGNWQLNDSIFIANVVTDYGYSTNVGVQQQLSGVFNKKTGILSKGTYVNTNPANHNGIFLVEKVK